MKNVKTKTMHLKKLSRKDLSVDRDFLKRKTKKTLRMKKRRSQTMFRQKWKLRRLRNLLILKKSTSNLFKTPLWQA